MNALFELTRAWRLASSPLRKLPDFIIAGAPKCGTSSLYDLIALHPDVRRGWRKEPTNFIHYPVSSIWSRMNQPFAVGSFLCGEGSVEYFSHPEAPFSAATVVPQAKVLLLLRDPVVRAWSEYRMFVKSGHEKEDFGLVVRRAMRWLSDPDARPLCEAASRTSFNPVRYVRCGMYSELIARWLEAFSQDQVLISFAEDLFERPQEVVRSVYSFLGLPAHAPASFPHARDSGNRSLPPADVVDEMRAFYAPYDEKLREFLGRSLSWDDVKA